LTITPAAGGDPLLEARVLSASERTIAIATPSPVEGEWLVLAVTTLDAVAAEARATAGAPPAQVGGEIDAPELVEQVPPQYAEQARREGRHGKVIFSVVVDVEGRVRAPMVLQVDPGLEDLTASAVEAVEKWRYRPATRDGVPIAVYFTIMVEYVLR
jgi:protein TonB